MIARGDGDPVLHRLADKSARIKEILSAAIQSAMRMMYGIDEDEFKITFPDRLALENFLSYFEKRRKAEIEAKSKRI
jgi:hypothetical protein